VSETRTLAVDLDGALADTGPLWQAWLDTVASVLDVDVAALPTDRGAAAAVLDERAGNWRALLERFCEERVAVYVRRDPATSEALRALAAGGWEIAIVTDAPEPLARLVLAQIGADRRVSHLETGTDAVERLRAELSSEPVVVTRRDELLALAVRAS
jgi:phosphoglycolate phosphatase-like HAD superfamily hydrolase